ncbi:MAG: glutathione peroxidase [Erysipelotrichales bacterium]|nr:MAG: glutathione peroxidase [Erysipelotrichales bacterium]
MDFYTFSAKKINGKEVHFDTFKGKVVLVVNTASKCGFTPQFEGLENLYKEYRDQGLEILGFPSNQFAQQDPAANHEILEFCQLNYGVTFTMFDKIDVNGENAHPLYKYLKQEKKSLLGADISWNFVKFLIDKEGNVVKRYLPNTKPKDLRKDVERYLAM